MSFLDPERALLEAHVEPGYTVVDIGSGSGAFSLAAAKMVGDGGHVYAIDVQNDLLLRLNANAHDQHLKNIDIVHTDAETGTKCRDGISDTVILSNILFQADNKDALMREASRITKKGGSVLLVDWSESFGNMGPRPEDVVTKNKALQMGGGVGLVVHKEFDAGDHHYGIVFRKS